MRRARRVSRGAFLETIGRNVLVWQERRETLDELRRLGMRHSPEWKRAISAAHESRARLRELAIRLRSLNESPDLAPDPHVTGTEECQKEST